MMNSMPDSGRLRWVVLTLVVGTLVCGAGVAGVLAVSDASQDRSQVGTGQQLATVITVTDEEVRHDVGVSAIDAAAERGDEAALAAALADRATVLTDRSGTIAAEFANVTAAYENGTLSEREFAWRLALLNARADAVQNGIAHVKSRAEAVPQPALDDAGYDADALAEARAAIDPLTGRGLAALLAQYTGESAGSFSVDAGEGLSVEVEAADGEYSREFERERSGDGPVAVDGLAALDAARDSLSGTDDGAWYLTELEFDRDDGVYELAFDYWSDTQVGEAEVAVDGATGEVFSLEEAREPRDGASALGIDVREGSLEPGGTATFVVTLDGEPVEGATVLVNDELLGRTDAAGTLSLSLPQDDDVEITVEYLDADAELELALGSPEDDGERDDDESEDDGGEDDESEDEDDDEQEDESEDEDDDESDEEQEGEEGDEEDDDEDDDEQEDESDDEQEGEEDDDEDDDEDQGDEDDDGEDENEEDDEDEENEDDNEEEDGEEEGDDEGEQEEDEGDGEEGDDPDDDEEENEDDEGDEDEEDGEETEDGDDEEDEEDEDEEETDDDEEENDEADDETDREDGTDGDEESEQDDEGND